MNQLRYFEYKHLPPGLQEISRPFCEAAHHLVEQAAQIADARENSAELHGKEVDDEQLEAALERLLETKDAAVRAFLDVQDFIEPIF